MEEEELRKVRDTDPASDGADYPDGRDTGSNT